MKLKMRYEDKWQELELTIEDVDQLCIGFSVEKEGLPESEVQKLLQEKVDEELNRPEYNVYHRETRHLANKEEYNDHCRNRLHQKRDKYSTEILQYDSALDNRQQKLEENEAYCERIRNLLKAKDVIEVLINRTKIRDYAELNHENENTVSRRYRRALKKLKKVWSSCPI